MAVGYYVDFDARGDHLVQINSCRTMRYSHHLQQFMDLCCRQRKPTNFFCNLSESLSGLRG